MRDRVVEHPNRYKLTPVSGDIYDLTPEPGVVTEQGSPLNKATLLTDATAEILGLVQANPTVDDAFFKLALTNAAIDGYPVAVSVVDYLGNPLPNVKVDGITGFAGGDAITDNNGYVLGVSPTIDATLSVTSLFLDLQDVSESVTLSSSALVRVTLALPAASSNIARITSSGNVRFSEAVADIDVCLIGGGAGGGGGTGWSNSDSSPWPGGGGGGGRVVNILGLEIMPLADYPLIVGSGGSRGISKIDAASTSGKDGGTTQCFGYSAAGGKGGGHGGSSGVGLGGDGNGKGGNGATGLGDTNPGESGGNGTVREFDDPSGELPGGGGGGAGTRVSSALSELVASGGASYGGSGAVRRLFYQTSLAALPGQGPGGGGGGGVYPQHGAAGYRGEIAIRWRYKTA